MDSNYRKKNFNISKILVTGGSGFVGQHLLEKLKRKGYEIYCLQREKGMKVNGFPSIYEPQLMNSSFTPDAIIHLAGLAHMSSRNAKKQGFCFVKSNSDMTAKIVNFAKLRRVRIFINISSISVLVGSSSNNIIDDNTKPAPNSPYAQSKYIGELHVKKLRQNNCLAVSLRPPLIIGLGAKGNWATLIRIASTSFPLPFGNINNNRSFIGIDDLCDRIIWILSQEPVVNKSGEYCVAGLPTLSFSEVLHEMRVLYMSSDRIFSVPAFVWMAIRKIPRISQAIEKISGNLILDDTRFRDTFEYNNIHPIKQQIKKSINYEKIRG